MKKIFRNLKFGLLLCAGAFAASCSDVEDAMNEIPYTRVLTPLNFEAKVDASVGTDINFSWSAVSNADSYILELFEAVPITSEEGEEVFTMPEDFDALTPYDQIEVAKDAVPYTVKNLTVDMSFWARVRGVSGKMDASHWAYLTEEVTTSAVRKGLNPAIAERTSSSVTVQWDDADDKDDLTSVRCELVVPVEGVAPINKTLSEDEKTACKVVFDELDPCTNYKFTLLFGKSGSRGVVTAYTRPEIGEVTTINSAEALYNAINGATGEVKLQLAYNDGALYDLTTYMTVKDGAHEPFVLTCSLTLYGESTAEGAKPVLRAAFTSAAAESSIHFEDLVFDGGKDLGATVTTGGPMTSAEFINCEFFDFTKGLWSGDDGFPVGSLIYDGVYAHDINATGGGGGDFIDIRTTKEASNYGSVEIKNSTFYACARSFFRCREGAGIGSVSVVNCTFNQVTTTTTNNNNSGIFDLQKFTPTAFDLTKCVFLNENSPYEVASENNGQWVKLTGNKNTDVAPTCMGNIFYNVGTTDKNGKNFFFNQPSVDLAGNTFSQELATKEGMILADDPCVNSIAGKMYLKTNSVIAANKAGDPRWWNAAMPEVVRATELETVTEATTWDFTDKTKFDTETIEANTIIENIRIYAPAEVVMGEGISFSAAATVNNKGIPTGSALAFKADGYGSVEVTAQGTGITSTVQIIAGSDAYSVNADGKAHKVVFGDLVGANEIYVLPSVAGIAFTKVAWIKDVEAEITTTQLATPKVTFDATSIDQGTEQAVTASWEAVAGAASYEVTFNNAKQPETAETTFVLDAAAVKALAVGEYKISVVAKPTETSTKYEASEAGEASFKIKKVILAGFSSVTWDFTQFDGTNLTDASTGDPVTWTNKAAFSSNVVWSLHADYPMTIMNGVTVDTPSNGAKTADGSSFQSSAPDKRAIYFTATAPGTLKYTAKSGNTSSARSTYVAVATASSYKLVYTSPEAIEEDTYEVDLTDLTGGETIYIFGKGNNFTKVEWTYVDENAPVQKELVWDFNDSGFDTIATAIKDDGTLSGNAEFEWDGLKFYMGGKTKYGTTTLNDKTVRFIQWGGKGKTTERSCYFTAPASGTLTVVASNTGSAEDLTRTVTVTVDGGGTESKPGGVPSSTTTTVTFDIDIDAASTVYVYPEGNGLRFFSVKYTYYE